MAVILKFEACLRTRRDNMINSGDDKGRRGDVVIFPGVWIERTNHLFPDSCDRNHNNSKNPLLFSWRQKITD